MSYIAYVTTYRGTGRPERTVVRPGSSLKQADPMAWHNDAAVVVGVYETPAEAAAAVQAFWDENVWIDEDGFSLWK